MLDELSSKKLKTMSVLFVENDDKTQDLVLPIISLLFSSVHTTQSGIDAYEKYSSLKIDLIITSIDILQIDGISFIKKIRQTDGKTPIIVISKHLEPKYLLEAIELNLVRFIPKPINEIKLLQALDKFTASIDGQKRVLFDNGWILDRKQNGLIIDAKVILLTKKEVRFLQLLSDKTSIVTYEDMAKKVWTKSEMSFNAMRLMVKNLRKKLPQDTIVNIHNLGYRIV